MGEHRGSWVLPAALALGIALAVAGCSSSGTTTGTTGSVASTASPTSSAGTVPSSGAPGVTATQINVGAISTLTGPIASNFESLVPGVRAYFDWINSEGGVNGRKLNLAYNLDDGGNPSQFTQLTHALIDQDHAFAAVGIGTAFFSPNYFVSTGTPAHGYDVTDNWSPAPNLFAAVANEMIAMSLDPGAATSQMRRAIDALTERPASDSDVVRVQNRLPAVAWSHSSTDQP